MTAPIYKNYYKDVGRKLTLNDVGKSIVRTLPFSGNRFFMVPKNRDPMNASVVLLSIDLTGLLCEAKTGDRFRVDGLEAFEPAYLTINEFLMKVRCEHIAAKEILNGAFDI
ncbi:MAG: hypothetical protein ACK4HV_02120 [Parachlamydiaceae bacterium]